MPPLAMSSDQVTVGPNYPNQMQAGRVKSLTLPKGPFDVMTVMNALPAEQKPELLAALVDSYRVCMPVNLASLTIPKLLIVGDTHHGQSPLSTMLSYVRREAFDGLILTYDPHHLHWFTEAGIAPATYIPSINVHHHPQEFNPSRKRSIVFVGQAGNFHPRRVRLLQAIQQAGLPLIVERHPPEQAAVMYNSHQITFNCSLNGDLNMRVFETMAAGGFLVTDRLSPQSGLHRLFRPGADYVEYDDVHDLIAQLRHYLDRPQVCLNIARSGHETYLESHTPEKRIREFFEFASEKVIAVPSDPRAVPGGEEFGENLAERVRVYEILQRIAQEVEMLRVLVDPALGARRISDLVDLPRLRVKVAANSGGLHALRGSLRQLGVADQVEFGHATMAGDVLVTDARSLASLEDARGLTTGLVILVDPADAMVSRHDWLTAAGFAKVLSKPWMYSRG